MALSRRREDDDRPIRLHRRKKGVDPRLFALIGLAVALVLVVGGILVVRQVAKRLNNANGGVANGNGSVFGGGGIIPGKGPVPRLVNPTSPDEAATQLLLTFTRSDGGILYDLLTDQDRKEAIAELRKASSDESIRKIQEESDDRQLFSVLVVGEIYRGYSIIGWNHEVTESARVKWNSAVIQGNEAIITITIDRRPDRTISFIKENGFWRLKKTWGKIVTR